MREFRNNAEKLTLETAVERQIMKASRGVRPNGEEIRRQRILADLTQAGLAKEAGLSESSISRLETGTTKSADAFILTKIAKALNEKRKGEEEVRYDDLIHPSDPIREGTLKREAETRYPVAITFTFPDGRSIKIEGPETLLETPIGDDVLGGALERINEVINPSASIPPEDVEEGSIKVRYNLTEIEIYNLLDALQKGELSEYPISDITLPTEIACHLYSLAASSAEKEAELASAMKQIETLLDELDWGEDASSDEPKRKQKKLRKTGADE